MPATLTRALPLEREGPGWFLAQASTISRGKFRSTPGCHSHGCDSSIKKTHGLWAGPEALRVMGADDGKLLFGRWRCFTNGRGHAQRPAGLPTDFSLGDAGMIGCKNGVFGLGLE